MGRHLGPWPVLNLLVEAPYQSIRPNPDAPYIYILEPLRTLTSNLNQASQEFI